ncbi:hypothetical protein SCLCIDRAFT_1209733 [Scleroderma citrinum Foug A]|uniref:Uncharacterized protein n=1 Tax=Scleroderma citrinum Foug A TaxID=1036808 RepID=A0A0C3EJ89_9AGAM|nr:hypothetical protein SCLCIDRAFT_1209733 [Scleroderma citrinum Foug A]
MSFVYYTSRLLLFRPAESSVMAAACNHRKTHLVSLGEARVQGKPLSRLTIGSGVFSWQRYP